MCRCVVFDLQQCRTKSGDDDVKRVIYARKCHYTTAENSEQFHTAPAPQHCISRHITENLAVEVCRPAKFLSASMSRAPFLCVHNSPKCLRGPDFTPDASGEFTVFQDPRAAALGDGSRFVAREATGGKAASDLQFYDRMMVIVLYASWSDRVVS